MKEVGLWVMLAGLAAAAIFAIYVFLSTRAAEKKRPLRKDF